MNDQPNRHQSAGREPTKLNRFGGAPDTSTQSQFDDRKARMLLSSMVESGDAEMDDLITAVGSVEAVERIWKGEVPSRLLRITAPAVAGFPYPARRADDLVAVTESCGARVIVPGDAEWPRQLADLRDPCTALDPHMRPPRCLWVRGEGDLAQLTKRSVTVTGARAASEYGKHVADDLASDLAEAGWTVVSGGAFGIDRAAHLGALARGGPTVAVLASGVDQSYPQANRSMFDLVVEKGLLVSEWPPGTSAMRHRFLTRGRVIAALTAGTVVVEAGKRSGALFTGRLAARLGRAVMFTPGPVTSSASAGVHRLAREQTSARLVMCAADIIEDLAGASIPTQQAPAVKPPFESLTAVEQWLVEALPRGYVVGTAHLAAAAGVPEETAAEALSRLRDRGWVERFDGRWRLPSARSDSSGLERSPSSPSETNGC